MTVKGIVKGQECQGCGSEAIGYWSVQVIVDEVSLFVVKLCWLPWASMPLHLSTVRSPPLLKPWKAKVGVSYIRRLYSAASSSSRPRMAVERKVVRSYIKNFLSCSVNGQSPFPESFLVYRVTRGSVVGG